MPIHLIIPTFNQTGYTVRKSYGYRNGQKVERFACECKGNHQLRIDNSLESYGLNNPYNYNDIKCYGVKSRGKNLCYHCARGQCKIRKKKSYFCVSNINKIQRSIIKVIKKADYDEKDKLEEINEDANKREIAQSLLQMSTIFNPLHPPDFSDWVKINMSTFIVEEDIVNFKYIYALKDKNIDSLINLKIKGTKCKFCIGNMNIGNKDIGNKDIGNKDMGIRNFSEFIKSVYGNIYICQKIYVVDTINLKYIVNLCLCRLNKYCELLNLYQKKYYESRYEMRHEIVSAFIVQSINFRRESEKYIEFNNNSSYGVSVYMNYINL